MTFHPAMDTSCPVPLQLLALLLRCDEWRLVATVLDLPDRQRAALAIYAFERYHMRRLAFAIAPQCTEQSLESVGGATGRRLIDSARNAAGPAFHGATDRGRESARAAA